MVTNGRPEKRALDDFGALLEKEHAWLNGAPRAATSDTPGRSVDPAESPHKVSPGAADEPWVQFTRCDRFGLALSGGGIRSATFNLGLLQALGSRGVLEHVDYLSTVSGGGYIGGFWTGLSQKLAEQNRNEEKTDDALPPEPLRLPGGPGKLAEPREIRHLREFSRFLMPRLGFAHSETWSGIVALLGSALPSLVATAAMITLVVLTWLGVCVGILQLSDRATWAGTAAFGLLTLIQHCVVELLLQSSGRLGNNTLSRSSWVWALGAAALSAAAWHLLEPVFLGAHADKVVSALFVVTEAKDIPYFSTVLLLPTLSWTAAAVALLSLRAGFSRFGEAPKAVARTQLFDHSAARCLAIAIASLAFALTWEGARNLQTAAFGPIGGGGVASGFLFVRLRSWLSEKPEETRASTLFSRMAKSLRPIAPQLLATAAVLAFVLGVVMLVQRYGFTAEVAATKLLEKRFDIEVPLLPADAHWARFIAGAMLLVLLATLLLFDPTRLGLHDFYRSRIARCFLGARHPGEAPPPATFEQFEKPNDDVTLKQMREAQRRPLHLVCCAANNLSGDVLTGLYRGARSAVLSPFGISIGDHAAPLDDLRLSAALTASGAAFNSHMGAISMRLGPSAALLMSALNLRLGLWVPHPLNPGDRHRFIPGLYFFLEAIGWSRCEPPSKPMVAKARALRNGEQVSLLHRLRLRMQNVHLSDGGHFENLGVYELVRRHCRYIILSDASADAETAFDDLANAVRRVREDFGVEIDLDVAPLRPDALGISRQHAVVGTIHYDGFSGADKGTIIYFKPTLTGDEPPDVAQYRTRNPAFPHEGTADQFYDEAQWESYRRLGQHQVGAALRFLEREAKKSHGNFIERLFLLASQQFHPSQSRQAEIFVELTGRCATLEAEMRDSAPPALRAEFFPEVAEVLGKRATPTNPEEVVDDTVRTLYFMGQVAQIMEDVWVAAELDIYWSHPLNEGWMSYFQRWASTPSFRRWWPLLRPNFSVGFRDFVKERFALGVRDVLARKEGELESGAELCLKEERNVPPGLARQQWIARGNTLPEALPEPQGVLTYSMKLESQNGAADRPIQVGFLIFNKRNDKTVSWNGSELFVPEPLMGAGIVARFLDAILVHFKGYEVRADLRDRREQRSDPATRQELLQDINFYKSRGFEYAEQPGSGPIKLVRTRRGSEGKQKNGEPDSPSPRA